MSSGDVDNDGLTDFLIGGSKVYLILEIEYGANIGNNHRGAYFSMCILLVISSETTYSVSFEKDC